MDIQTLDIRTLNGYTNIGFQTLNGYMQTLNCRTFYGGHLWNFMELYILDAQLFWFISKSPDLVEGSTTPRQ